MNAFEQDGKLICDVCEYPEAPLFLDLMDRWATPVKPMPIAEWTLDVDGDTNTYKSEPLETGSQNFPDWTSVEQV